MASEEKMRELIEELWESDAACALTNRAARALESALHSVEADKEPEWLDINSAPKDRHILGCQSRHGIMRVVRGPIDEFGNWSTGPSSMDFLAEVTHWMELPAPPEHVEDWD